MADLRSKEACEQSADLDCGIFNGNRVLTRPNLRVHFDTEYPVRA